MTIEVKPEHERVIAEAIQAGVIRNAEEALDVGLAALRRILESRETNSMTPEERLKVLDAFFAEFESDIPLPPEAFERENWYPDRR